MLEMVHWKQRRPRGWFILSCVLCPWNSLLSDSRIRPRLCSLAIADVSVAVTLPAVTWGVCCRQFPRCPFSPGSHHLPVRFPGGKCHTGAWKHVRSVLESLTGHKETRYVSAHTRG